MSEQFESTFEDYDGLTIDDKTDDDWKDFSKKFLQYYKEALKDCTSSFFIDFQIYNYVITHFSNKQVIDLLPNFIVDFFNSEEKCISFYYDNVVPLFQETVTKEINNTSKQIMTTYNVSQLEALIAVDKAFNEQIGYFSIFADCIMGSYMELKTKEEYDENGD